MQQFGDNFSIWFMETFASNSAVVPRFVKEIIIRNSTFLQRLVIIWSSIKRSFSYRWESVQRSVFCSHLKKTSAQADKCRSSNIFFPLKNHYFINPNVYKTRSIVTANILDTGVLNRLFFFSNQITNRITTCIDTSKHFSINCWHGAFLHTHFGDGLWLTMSSFVNWCNMCNVHEDVYACRNQ